MSFEENSEREMTIFKTPEDLIHNILSFLPVQSLLTFNQTCKTFRNMTNQHSFWEARFRHLVQTKLFVSNGAFAVEDPKEAYKKAYQDRLRTTITKDELFGRVWYFWFKRSAGEDWTCWDPFWVTRGRECRKMVFMEDGSVLEFYEEENESGSGRTVQDIRSLSLNCSLHHTARREEAQRERVVSEGGQVVEDSISFSTATGAKRLRLAMDARKSEAGRNTAFQQPSHLRPSTSDKNRRNHSQERAIIDPANLRPVFHNEPSIPNIVMKWRFITHPLDFAPRKNNGGFIRLVVGGREVPTYVVRRFSDDNWGFLMENCWGVFCSFDVTSNSRGAHNNADAAKHFISSFRDDPKWNTVTTEIQWKEAMLYNNGASVLPESH